MANGRGRRRLVAAIAVNVALLTAAATVPAAAEEAGAHDYEPPAAMGDVLGLAISDAESLAAQVVAPTALGPWQPAAPEPHVVVLSSGVDVASLPEALADQITLANTYPDRIGYGTWAAATILQTAPGARVTSINLFPNGRLEGSWVRYALDWVRQYKTDPSHPAVDAVLLAFPPHEYLDPLSVAQDPASTVIDPRRLPVALDELEDDLLDNPFLTSDGASNLATSTDWLFRGKQLANVGEYEKGRVTTFHRIVEDWRLARIYIADLAAKGVAVVAPAGDLGARLQSIAGLAHLREVITVGAAVPDSGAYAVAATSASGPSLEGAVKPDVIPT